MYSHDERHISFCTSFLQHNSQAFINWNCDLNKFIEDRHLDCCVRVHKLICYLLYLSILKKYYRKIGSEMKIEDLKFTANLEEKKVI